MYIKMISSKIRFFLLYFFGISLVIAVIYIIFPNILYSNIIIPILKDGLLYPFADWLAIISAVKCKLMNYDVFTLNPCDVKERAHVYGSILLYIPLVKGFDSFYLLYFPIFINLIFVLVIILHFDLTKFKEFLLFLLIILNPSTLILMERLNTDIFILLILIFLCYFRSNILNIFLITSATLAKFFPIALIPLFFLTKQKKFLVNFIYFVIFILIISSVFYIDRYNLIKIFYNQDQYVASFRLSFSFISFAKIISVTKGFSNILFLIISAGISLLIIFLTINYLSKNNIFKEFNFDDYRELLFLVGGGLLVSTYIVFNNYLYREIFLFCLIPYLLNKRNQNKIFKFVLYFMSFRYFYFMIANYYAISNKEYFLLTFKYFFDLCFMSVIASVILILYLRLSKKLIQHI